MFAGTGNDQGSGFAFVVQLVQHVVEFAPKRGMHGVERFGLVQHQMRNVVIHRQRKAIEFVHGDRPRAEQGGKGFANCSLRCYQALSRV